MHRILIAPFLALVLVSSGAAGRDDTGRLGFAEAQAIFVSGDVEALHQRFAAHRKAFAAGEMSGMDFARPFYAFFVYSAERVATIAAWRRRWPDDPAAMAAEGAHHHHVALLIGYRRVARGWGPLRRERWNAANERAASKYAAAIEVNPAQIFAARQMHWLSRFVVGEARWAIAEAALETHASPAYLTEWRIAKLSRQRQPEGVVELCAEATGTAPGLDENACYAIALYHFRPRNVRLTEIVERFEAADQVAFPREQLRVMGDLHRPLDDLVAFARANDIPFHTYALLDIAEWTNPEGKLEGRDLLAETVKVDPDHPLLASRYATVVNRRYGRGPAKGRTARLRAQRSNADEITMRLLARHDFSLAPYNAALWPAIAFALPRNSGQKLPFMERAVQESGNDPDAWLFAADELIDPREWIGLGPDHRPLASFECRKRNLLRLVEDGCALSEDRHQICEPAALRDVAAELNDIATITDLDCGDAPDLGVETPPEVLEEKS
ncbi:MAG: hypothetical protein AAF968_11515 [Pseudomonadota bacterium]